MKKHKLTRLEIQERYRERHPEKIMARRAIFRGLRNGNIKKQPCRVCGEEKVEAHHRDYSKPYLVWWLCRKHHLEQDKKEAQKVFHSSIL